MHAQHTKHANAIKREAEERMDKLQSLIGEARQPVKFLLDAVKMVISCRKFLKWTYPWIFFINKDDDVLYNLIKTHQDKMEKYTEQLYQLTETPIGQLHLPQNRNKIVSLTRFLANYRSKLVEFAQ